MTSAIRPIAAVWAAGAAALSVGVTLSALSLGLPPGSATGVSLGGALLIAGGIGTAWSSSRRFDRAVLQLVSDGAGAQDMGVSPTAIGIVRWIPRVLALVLVFLSAFLLPAGQITPAYPLFPIMIGLLALAVSVQRLGAALRRGRQELLDAEAADAVGDQQLYYPYPPAAWGH